MSANNILFVTAVFITMRLFLPIGLLIGIRKLMKSFLITGQPHVTG